MCRNEIIQIGNIRNSTEKFSNPQCGRVYLSDGIAPTLNTCGGGAKRTKSDCDR